MLHRKSTNLISEIGKYFKDTDTAMGKILDTILRFKMNDSRLGLESKSIEKVSLSNKLIVLLLMPFVGVKKISGLKDSRISFLLQGGVDMQYRMQRAETIDWRKLYSRFIRLILKRLPLITDDTANQSTGAAPNCLIIDDTDAPKRGEHLELIGRIFSHVLQKSILGYKILMLGFNNGSGFVPIDFSMHGELGKNKDQGLTAKKRSLRHDSKTPAGTPMYVRKGEYFKSKIKVAVSMLRRNRNLLKDRIDYVLCDSWFFCEELIKCCRSLGRHSHILAMAKIGKTKYRVMGKDLDAHELITRQCRKFSRCRKYNCQYFTVDAEFKGYHVRLFFCRHQKNKKWRLMVSTDTTLSFVQAYEIYAMRWSIEVFFKESKQYLGLGKCQAKSLAAQIASVTVCMMQYSLLALVRMLDDYKTIGGLFRETQDNVVDITVYEKIMIVLQELLEAFADYVGLPDKRLVYNFLNSEQILSNIGLLKNTQQVA